MRRKLVRRYLRPYEQIQHCFVESCRRGRVCRCHACRRYTEGDDVASSSRLSAALRILPTWLKPSAYIDLGLVLARARSTLRTELEPTTPLSAVHRWARKLGFFVAIDEDGFVVLSRQPGAARRTLAIDRRPGNHVQELGRLLGYPSCCCRAAARVGEACLDEFASTMGRRRYLGRFKAIDPSGYGSGRAFISHIPCSAVCMQSLALALTVVEGRKRMLWPLRRPPR